MSALPLAIFMMGPTASGKTQAAVELAQQLPVEIISVDSALIYRDMNIGTAKPSLEILAHTPHHLIDILSPTDSYSAATFCHDALRLMKDVTQRGRIPLLVGGTMLYFHALRFGLNELPKANLAIRTSLQERSVSIGWPALHAELNKIDPRTAERLKPNDAQRIQRALEIYQLTGQPMSMLLNDTNKRPLPYNTVQISLTPSSRDQLHTRIATRFSIMLKHGLVAELRALQEMYTLHQDLPSMRCVGYRQAWKFLTQEISETELFDKGTAATRQLAKRQLTWLRHMPGIVEIDCLANNVVRQILTAIHQRQN